jgi:cytochrome d ubiquinol oxidase subunit I
MVGIAAYQLRRSSRQPAEERDRVKVASMRTSLRLGLVVALLAGLGAAVSGDALGKVMFEQQPMKMAAAEALWDGQSPAPFSIFAVGDVSKGHNSVEVTVPGLLSFLAKGNFSDEVPGINDTNAAEKAKYGDLARNADYRPNIPTTFWAFRWMIGFGMTSFVIGAAGLWLTRRRFWLAPEFRRDGDEVPLLMLTRTKPLSPFLDKWAWRLAVWTMGFPLIANSWGWIFTEMGRQPWAVYGLMTTASAVSPSVSVGEQVTSLTVFTVLYGILAVVEVKLLVKYAKAGPTDEQPPTRDPRLRPPGGGADADADKPLAFAY